MCGCVVFVDVYVVVYVYFGVEGCVFVDVV